jgi:hypothetical protein
MSSPDTVPLTPGTPLPEPLAGLHPARIGPYRILRVLGQGGMGLDSLADTLARRTASQLAALYEGWGKPDRAAEYRRQADGAH